eukprot:489519-Amphidinium_carterae.1
MSKEAEGLLDRRNQAALNENHDDEKELTKEFRKQMKKDKRQHLIELLNDFDGPRQNWKGIKRLHSNHQPRVIIRGRTPIRPDQLPEATAMYYDTTHWPTPPHPRPNTQGDFLVNDNLMFNQAPFTMLELDMAINALDPSRAPGPDE